MKREFVLALDQGTTGSTALLFDSKARLLARSYRELRQIYPRSGWVEHDPEEILTVTRDVGREALHRAGVGAAEVTALGLTNQRETTLLWERADGRPVHNAVVWQCRRTADLCARLRNREIEAEVRQLTGLLIDPYFSATKISWLLQNVPGAREKAEAGRLAFGTVDAWLIWRLTGGAVHATDYTNASRTMLLDIHRRKWSSRLCGIFGVPESLLPDLRNSAGDFGSAAAEHFGAPIPIRGAAGDQQAALFGHGAVRDGQAKCTFGTGAFVVAYCGKTPPRADRGLLGTLACDAQGEPAYALEGSIFMAGAVLQWLRDGLGVIATAAETEAIARSLPDSAGVYLVPAFVGLGAPHWDADARAAIVGMTRGTTRAHIVRAALEAIAFQTADLVDAMNADSPRPISELRVDGGAAANDFLLQFLADLLDLPVVRPPLLELTGFGAARLAARGSNLWREHAEPAGRPTLFRPEHPVPRQGPLRRGWDEAVRRVLTR